MRPVLPAALLFGSALGAAFAWQLGRDRAAAPTVSPTAATRPASAPADALAPRPTLTSRETGSALAAWLKLPRSPGGRANLAARAESLRALLVRLPAAEFPRLLDSVHRLDDEARDDLRRIAFDAWLELDPAAAARWAFMGGASTENLLYQAVKIWTARDPLAAIAWIVALPADTLASDLARHVVGQLPPADLARAMGLIETRGPAFRDSLAAALFRPLAKTAPAAAIRAFGPAMWRRSSEIWQLDTALAAWARTDLDGALAWIAAQPRNDSQDSITARLGTDDASRARLGAALLARPDFPLRQATLGQLISDWAETSPGAALAWLDTVQDRDLRNRILERATRGYSPEHPELDLPLVLAREPGRNRDEALAYRLEKWAKLSPEAALAWIAARADEPAVARATPRVHGTILGALAAESPEAAVREWGALPDPATRVAALGPIVDAWSRSAPEAALSWGTGQLLATGEPFANWQVTPLQEWVGKKPAEALAWIENLPDDRARRALFGRIVKPSPNPAGAGRAADLYACIKDPALRSELLTAHVKDWMRYDPASAKTWLDTHDTLTPEQAAAILSTPAP